MKQIRANFYIFAVLGVLLEPLLAETEITKTAGDFITTSPGLQNLNADDRKSSVDVSNATEAYDVNTTRAENSTISGTQMPVVEETNTMTKTSNVSTTTEKMEDVPTTAKDTRPITKIESRTPAPTDSHEETPRTSVYVIVLVLVILGVAVFGIIFFCVKSNRKRFSVDIHAKHEDAQIPLASVEPEICDSSPKGTDLKTLTSDESSPTDGLEKTEEQKADQQVTESPAKSQTTEAPAEKSPEPIDVDDADPSTSTKTSVETLNDVLNDNNSNNNAGTYMRDVSVSFIEICLND